MVEMLTCVLMWLGHQVAAWDICLCFQIGQILRTFTIFPTTSTTACSHHGFELDYNYRTAFWACYIIIHEVSWNSVVKVDYKYICARYSFY